MLNKVFFIDDDSVALMINRKLAEKSLFAKEVVVALNGEIALNYYKELLENSTDENTHPDIIFLDLNMPIMDGWEFLEEFSKPVFDRFKNTKIIVLSSSINPQDLARVKQYPMVMDFVCKPVTIEILEELSKSYSA